MESNLIKLDTQLAEYVAMHFYKKGYEDGQNEKVKYSREKKYTKWLLIVWKNIKYIRLKN